ncbi:hypothetical protein [Adhaeribacter aquaticus]|uniref:hypothetical protein n=1 Tax=Adhaeribacter aquaticus TaxID=299567 RepID=UPI000688E630|nr:hypothetical protein [Adhaeribacter aquaticus]
MIIKTFIFQVAFLVGLASCSSENNSKQPAAEVNLATEQPANNHSPDLHKVEEKPGSSAEAALFQPGQALPKELVCMVNNAYMGKKQFPVNFEDKLYYGCCQMCVKTIQNEHQVRVATDPLTGKEVDKSSAFITLNPTMNNGSVLYFESEANYQKFINQAGKS